MSGIYEIPPILSGSAENQLRQLRDYLVRMARDTGHGQSAAETTAAQSTAGITRVSRGGAPPQTAAQSVEDARKRADALRALIVKTAKQQQADKEALEAAIDDVEGTTLLHIDSSRGTLFKHNAVQTRLTVVLFRGGQRITDAAAMRETFGPSAHLQWSWQRMGEEHYGIISASDSRLSNEGFCFILSPDDVDTKVTFRCELVV